MKYVAVIFAATALLSASEPQAKKSSPSAPASAAPQRITIPEGSVRQPDGRYRFTDTQGRNWVYVRTPMGVSRFEDKPGASGSTADSSSPKPAEPFANVKVTESGDTVTFERPSPFGVSKWTKKKSELTEQENGAMLRAREKGNSSDTARQD
jgi:hypothetical protein